MARRKRDPEPEAPPPRWTSSPAEVPDLARAFEPGATVAIDGVPGVVRVARVGQVKTGGRVVSLDPLVGEHGPAAKVPKGTHPVLASVLRAADGSERLAAMALAAGPGPVERWERAPSHWVESGASALADAPVAAALEEEEGEAQRQVADLVDGAAEGTLHLDVPLGRGRSVAVCLPGYLDGLCIQYRGLDAGGGVVAVVVGFGLLPGDELQPTDEGAGGGDAPALLRSLCVTLFDHGSDLPADLRPFGRVFRRDAELRLEGLADETAVGPEAIGAALLRHGVCWVDCEPSIEHGPPPGATAEAAEVGLVRRAEPGLRAATLRVESDGRRLVRARLRLERPAPRTKVPAVVGLWWQRALRELEQVGLSIRPEGKDEPSTAPADQVLRQTPAAGAEVVKGTVVRIAVSAGPPDDTFTLPGLEGLSLDQAKGRLSLLGLTLGEVTSAPGGVPGTVTTQRPAAGTGVFKGARVDLTVAT